LQGFDGPREFVTLGNEEFEYVVGGHEETLQHSVKLFGV
jgi:hypothetical protein